MRIHQVLLLVSCFYIGSVASAEPNAGDEITDGSGSNCSWGNDGSGSGSVDSDWTRCDSSNVNAGSGSGQGSRSGSEDFDIDAGSATSSGSSSQVSAGSTGNDGGNVTGADKTQSGIGSPPGVQPQKNSASQIAPAAVAAACIVAITSALLA